MARERIDISGQKFGRWTAVRFAGHSRDRVLWEFVCDCGNVSISPARDKISGKSNSCGCLSREKARMNLIDLTGKKFNKLLVIKRFSTNKRRVSTWECVCECGVKVIRTTISLRDNHISQCKKCKGSIKIKHGKKDTKEYRSWSAMKGRCYNKNNKKYPLYGGRGITVCDRWRDSFENFLTDMKECPKNKISVDRIDVNGNYEPLNCRWADAKEQANNKRKKKAQIV